MQIAVRPRLALSVALLSATIVMLLTLPGAASAATLTCKGHTSVGTPSEDFENPLGYRFACTGRIVGFMLLGDREISGFDTELEVHDPAGVLVPSDGFACEGDIPGTGVGCMGTYGTNNVIAGTVDIADRQACVEPRQHLQLVVVAETIDAVTGVPKKTSTGALGGPFDLGRPQGCKQKSSILGGLLAEVALLRAEIRAARS